MRTEMRTEVAQGTMKSLLDVEGHTSNVKCLASFPSVGRLFSGASDNLIRSPSYCCYVIMS